MDRQKEIINELNVKPAIIATQEIEKRTEFLASYLGKTGLGGFVLGISGGQDSFLAGLLAQRAVEQRRRNGFDAYFHAVMLPYGNQTDRSDAELAIDTIAPDVVHDIDIKPAVDGMIAAIADDEGEPVADFDKGNIKARARMIAQYALAGKHNLLVIGTDHAAEAVTGFFTKFGDGGADILPLSGLTKSQGREMLTSLGAPTVFITKPPTADLLDNKPGQADEAELGIPYIDIDRYLTGKVVPNNIAARIEARYTSTGHKRSLPVAFS